VFVVGLKGVELGVELLYKYAWKGGKEMWVGPTVLDNRLMFRLRLKG